MEKPMPESDSTVEVPPWPKFVRPLLEVLGDGQSWKTSDLESATTDRIQLSDVQRTQTLKSGQSQAYNRVGWALSALTRAKAVEKVKIGESRITDFGLQMLADQQSRSPKPISRRCRLTRSMFRPSLPGLR